MGLPGLRKAQDDSGVLYLKRLLAATLLKQDYTGKGVLRQRFSPSGVPSVSPDDLSLVSQTLVVAIKVRYLSMGKLLQPNPRLAVGGQATGSVDACLINSRKSASSSTSVPNRPAAATFDPGDIPATR